MDDGPGNIKIIPDYFDSLSSTTVSSDNDVQIHQCHLKIIFVYQLLARLLIHWEICVHHILVVAVHPVRVYWSKRTSHGYLILVLGPLNFRAIGNCLLIKNKFRTASFMLRFFGLRGLLSSGSSGEEKVELTAAQLESLQSELADVAEREAYFKAQLEHLDQILRQARLSGYLCIRTRWAALPGEPPPIDDGDVDDWIPRFVVFQGSCMFFYLSATDLSPQESTLLSEISEVVELSSFVRENEEVWHCFYIGTQYGLRIECSSVSRIQVHPVTGLSL
uniref:Nucleoside-diphosphate kinase n=1 Tax=Opuntia streptacantha TaxID=393608 RepID=A0A7C9CQG5_OPUST